MYNNNELAKRKGENQLEHHKRLLFGKLENKTIDADYSELSDYLYEKHYSSDVARRMAYGSFKTLKIIDKLRIDLISKDDAVKEIDDKIIELNMAKQKFYDQRREYNRLLQLDARNEHLCEALIGSAQNLEKSVGCMYGESGYNPNIASGNEAILVFSDWHFGLKTENVFNKFDIQICKDRIARVVNSTVERIKLHSCRKLHIVVLGDLYHGAIHNSARVASEELACDQLMQAAEILAQSVEYLSRFVEETAVYMTYGNHARTIQNKNDSIHRDNMERIIPWWLEQRLARYSNIKVVPDNGTEFIFVNACGHEICAVHGDNDSVRTSPRLLSTLFQKKQRKDIEYILLGDKHHRESFDELGITALLCGSLCGTDDYANDKRLYSEPSQLLLIANRECGVDAEYRIKCD